MEFMGNNGHAPALPILCGFASVSHAVACARCERTNPNAWRKTEFFDSLTLRTPSVSYPFVITTAGGFFLQKQWETRHPVSRCFNMHLLFPDRNPNLAVIVLILRPFGIIHRIVVHFNIVTSCNLVILAVWQPF